MTGLENALLAAHLFVVPFWLLMVFAPHWRVTRRVIGSPVGFAVLPALYVALALPHLGDVLPQILTPTPPGVAAVTALLSKPENAAIGWIHYLAFDLFVGRWIYLDNRELQLSAWLVSPLLVLTFLLGPAGLLAYLLVRGAVRVRKRKKPPVESLGVATPRL